MKARSSVMLSSLLTIAAAGVFLEGGVAAQYGERTSASRTPASWENDQFRVRRIALAPGAQIVPPEGQDTVLVFLTADLDGRMPPAEAVWLDRGPRPLENRGHERFEAIAIGVKDGPASGRAGTPAELVNLTDQADVRVLIDGPRAMVLKARYRSNAYATPLHFHPRDLLAVYLAGGYTWLPKAEWGSYRVTRGEVDLVPADTLHLFGNAGSDPLDCLLIVPK
jgi:quercetin dioxygenase-like cupin family protein